MYITCTCIAVLISAAPTLYVYTCMQAVKVSSSLTEAQSSAAQQLGIQVNV